MAKVYVVQTSRPEYEARLLAEFDAGRTLYLSIALTVDGRPNERRYIYTTTCGKQVFYSEKETYGRST